MTQDTAFRVLHARSHLANALAQRTFPRYRPLLGQAGITPGVIALALMDGRDAIGLLLGRVVGGLGSLLSISVADGRRRQGGGALLLATFEHEAMRQGARQLATSFTADRGPISPILALLEKSGWGAPSLTSTMYTLDRQDSLKAPWFTGTPPRLGGMVIQPWSAVGEQALRMIGPANWCAEELHPRSHVGVGQDGAPQNYEASALLRGHAEPDAPVLGWVIVHQTDERRARVTAVAVHPDRLNSFAGGALIAHANQVLFDAGTEAATFVVRPEERRMRVFAERRIVPLGARVRESFELSSPLLTMPSVAVN